MRSSRSPMLVVLFFARLDMLEFAMGCFLPFFTSLHAVSAWFLVLAMLAGLPDLPEVSFVGVPGSYCLCPSCLTLELFLVHRVFPKPGTFSVSIFSLFWSR